MEPPPGTGALRPVVPPIVGLKSRDGVTFAGFDHEATCLPSLNPLQSTCSSAIRSGGQLSLQSGSSSFRGTWSSKGSARSHAGGSPRIPGALAYLYAQPQVDEERARCWVEARSPTEQALRTALRTCVYGPGGKATPRDASRRHRRCQFDEVQHLLGRAEHQMPPDEPLLHSARARLQRIEGLKSPEPDDDDDDQVAELDMSHRVSHSQHHQSLTGWNRRYSAGQRSLAGSVCGSHILALAEGAMAMVDKEGLKGCPCSSRGIRAAFHSRLRGLESYAHEAPDSCATAGLAPLAAHLVRPAKTREEKAWVIFCWICHHVDIINLSAQDPHCTAADVLAARRGGGRGIAELFAALCAEVELQAQVVRGICHGGPGERPYEHAWNALLLDSEWGLVDCAWASRPVAAPQSAGRPRLHRPYYFCPHPKELAFTHFPAEARWQMIPKPVSREAFLAFARVTGDVFFGSGLSFQPEFWPRARLALRGCNAGTVRLKVPQGVDVMGTVDGERARCFQERASEATATSINVLIQGASRLRRSDPSGSSDPFCVCEVVGKPGTRFETRTVRGSLNPHWNEGRVLEDCNSGDILEFTVWDRDHGCTKDDVLGVASMPVERLLAGIPFAGDLDLQEGGRKGGALLKVKLDIASTEKRRLPQGAMQDTWVHFRVPPGPAQRRLELFARREGGEFRSACSFDVVAPTDLKAGRDLVEPCFPDVDLDAFRAHGLAFEESLPLGRIVLEKRNEAARVLFAPPDVEVTADVDGNAAAALVQRDGDRVRVYGLCPAGGEHKLRVHVCRTTDGRSQPQYALGWKLAVAPHGCSLNVGGFVQQAGLFHELGGVLREPRWARLRPGLHKFRLCFAGSGEKGRRIVVRAGDGREKAEEQELQEGPTGHFEGQVVVQGSDVTVHCLSPSQGELGLVASYMVAINGWQDEALRRASAQAGPALSAAASVGHRPR